SDVPCGCRTRRSCRRVPRCSVNTPRTSWERSPAMRRKRSGDCGRRAWRSSEGRWFDLGGAEGIRCPAAVEAPSRHSGRSQMSAHHKPEDIRKNLDHPVIDGDGHWVEYTPVFAEQIRKVTGDLGANGFLQSQRRIPDSLGLTLEQRMERGVAMEGFWGRQSTNTRDRATAMITQRRYERL